MKITHLSVLIASLFAGAAMAQPSSTTKMPDPNSAVTTPAGAAQGRAQTSVNEPQQGSNVKATPVPGSVAKPDPDKVVNTKSSEVQGTTSSAAKAGVEHPGAKSDHGKTMNQSDSNGKSKAAPAVVVTTPAPGPVNTTPSRMNNSPSSATK